MKGVYLSDFEGNFSLKHGLDQDRVQWLGFMLKCLIIRKLVNCVFYVIALKAKMDILPT
jgi:hypothetical protein